MLPDRHCLCCTELLRRNFTRSNQKFCDRSCQASYWYQIKYKQYYADRYQKQKKQWESSPNGKKAGVTIREWLKLPKEWR